MGPYAFQGTNEIDSIIYSSKLKKIPDYAFDGAGITSLDFEAADRDDNDSVSAAVGIVSDGYQHHLK